jgi:hypothetical protein
MENEDLKALIQEATAEELSPRQSFDMVIPGEIRANPNLTRDEKYLYALIRNLTTQKGYCWATNKYLGKEMGVTDRTIKTWIAHLEKEGAIEMQYISHGLINRRRIWLTGAYEFKKFIIGKSASPSSGNPLPHDREASFPYTEERRDLREKDEEGTRKARATASTKISINIDKRAFEGITQKDLEAWKEKFPNVNLDRELSRCAEWAISTKRQNYRKSILSWLTNCSEKKSIIEEQSGDTNIQLAQAILKRFPEKQETGEIDIFDGCLIFSSYGNSKPFPLNDKFFRGNVLERLKKMGLNIEGL